MNYLECSICGMFYSTHQELFLPMMYSVCWMECLFIKRPHLTLVVDRSRKDQSVRRVTDLKDGSRLNVDFSKLI